MNYSPCKQKLESANPPTFTAKYQHLCKGTHAFLGFIPWRKRITEMEYVLVLLFQNVIASVQGWPPGNEPVLCWVFTRNRIDPFPKTRLNLIYPECPCPGLPGAHLRTGTGASQCQSEEPQYMTTPAFFSLCKRTKLVLPLVKPAQLPQFPWYVEEEAHQ